MRKPKLPCDENGEPQDWLSVSSLRELEREAADNHEYESAIAYRDESWALHDKLEALEKKFGKGIVEKLYQEWCDGNE